MNREQFLNYLALEGWVLGEIKYYYVARRANLLDCYYAGKNDTGRYGGTYSRYSAKSSVDKDFVEGKVSKQFLAGLANWMEVSYEP